MAFQCRSPRRMTTSPALWSGRECWRLLKLVNTSIFIFSRRWGWQQHDLVASGVLCAPPGCLQCAAVAAELSQVGRVCRCRHAQQLRNTSFQLWYGAQATMRRLAVACGGSRCWLLGMLATAFLQE